MTQPAALEPRVLAFGDCALLVEFGNTIDRAISAGILALKARILAAGLPGVVETVPTFRSLLVRYDPLQTSFEALSATVVGLLEARGSAAQAPRHWQVPVCYEADCAPDLASVADALGLAPAELLDLHLEVTYHVYMIGFVAGYPYLGDLPQQLSLPRRKDPRVRVPKGSVAIALTMAAIYPIVSPGGWHLIGQTPIKLFDPSWPQPALFAPGDRVAFQPIGGAEFRRLQSAVDEEGYQIEARVSPP